MAEQLNLRRPWMVAVWPGIGQVALNAGFYMLGKMRMQEIAELQANSLFDVEEVEVRAGRIQAGQFPRNRLFLHSDSRAQRDLVVFVGETQPPVGKYLFCQRLIEFAKELGVERVFTFAALGTQMQPDQPSRVLGAATNEHLLKECRRLELEIVQDGTIAGLNGVLLGAAAEHGVPGTCLFGEMPQMFSQLPYPKATLAILEVFATMADLDLDLEELKEQVTNVDGQLQELVDQVERSFGANLAPDEPLASSAEERISAFQRERIEEMFDRARQDRTKARELKHELDRLRVFGEYEDRFLDLFRKRTA